MVSNRRQPEATEPPLAEWEHLELAEPETRTCLNAQCGASFLTRWRKQFLCPTCVRRGHRDQWRREARDAYAVTGLRGKLTGYSFGSFAKERQPEGYAAARAFIERWPRPGWLFLRGKSGSGKTHLCAAIVNALFGPLDPPEDPDPEREERQMEGLTRARVVGRYAAVPALSFYLATAEDYRVAANQAFAPLVGAPLLVLDDLGDEQLTGRFLEGLNHLFAERDARELPTIVATKHSSAVFVARVGEPIDSRIEGASTQVDLRDVNYRLSKARR